MPLQTNYRSRLALFIPIAIASFAFWGISGFRPTVQGRDSASPVTPPAPFASPSALAICPDQRHALVTLATANAVALIDLEAGTVLQEIPVGQQPNGVALSADGNLAAVSCRMDGSIFLLGAGRGKRTNLPGSSLGKWPADTCPPMWFSAPKATDCSSHAPVATRWWFLTSRSRQNRR